ncbi:Clp protease N-terminal domain-containing protein [Streptomyces pactum]|uniref:Peptidase n=1 Tax=Streptomyces pactum TaxID=68249 RepID=A0A1S6JG14_9ACTN|nr:Clp protease N-terminal domain-containing protein [Streptomyces pactum]AQS70703.1 peptidase [Streptomyces pactum]
MQPCIPRQSAGEQGARRPDGTDLDARFGEELAPVVTGARRRAVRDGDRQIDTAHLLHSLIEYDPEARAVLGEGPQVARLLGYLVQRSIGYGLRWQSTVEDSGAVPVVTGAAGFSPLAATAMEGARARAVRRGADRPTGVDLLAALVTDPQARAVEVLGRAAVEPRTVLARVENHFEPTP